MSRRVRILAAFAFIAIAVVPALAQVQTGSILVHARDAQGEVLPGVVITISSPALVSGQMTATTDAGGAYRFPSLPPGTYEVKLALAGFEKVDRQDIVVSVGQTTTLDQQMGLAKLEESVTVTSQSPVVDTTSANESTTLNQKLLQATPGGRDIWSLAEYKIPGLATNRPDVGGNQGGLQAGMSARGTANGQNTQFLNGINVGDPAAIGYTQFYYDYDAFQEIQVSVGAHDLSVPSSGLFLNMITRSGTDDYHGSGSVFWQGHQTQASNIGPALLNEGLSPTAGNVDFVSDVNAMVGGPIVRKRLRFFGSFRDWRVHTNVPGFPELDSTNITSGLGNFTYQVSDRNRLTGFVSRQRYYKPNRGASAFNTPQSDWKEDDLTSIYQALWNSVLKPNAFLDARVSYNNLFFPLHLKSPDVSVLDLATNIRTGSNTNEFQFTRRRLQANVNLSYYLDNVAHMRHEFRVGVDYAHAPTNSFQFRNDDINLFTRAGVPAFVTEYNTPVLSKSTVNTMAAFGQDSIAIGRVTINAGARFQHTEGYLPAQSSPAGTFADVRSFPEIRNVISWNTVSPRVGVIYDPTGSGQMAFKASAARYYYTISTGDPNIVNQNGLSFTQYGWNDLNHDGQFQPGEENGVTARGGANITSIDPALKQPHTDELLAAFEREVMPDLRVSIVGTYRRERDLYGPVQTGFDVATGYTPVSIVDPGSDGIAGTVDDQAITVFNQDKSTIPLSHLLYTNSPLLNQTYRGIEVTATKRFSRRWQMLAGYTYGKARQVNTYVGQYTTTLALNDPNTNINSNGATFYDRPHTFKLTGSYVLWHDIQVSGNVRAQSGTAWSYNQSTDFRVLRTTLNQGSVVIFANAPGDVRTPTVKTLDLRGAKVFHFRNGRDLEGSVDIYNVFNSATAFDINPFTGTSKVVNPVSGAVNVYPSFGLPTGILGPRIVRLGAKFTF